MHFSIRKRQLFAHFCSADKPRKNVRIIHRAFFTVQVPLYCLIAKNGYQIGERNSHSLKQIERHRTRNSVDFVDIHLVLVSSTR